MIPHPEGGYFKESYRDKNVSLIYYLLKKNEKSHWHRLTKNEILHFYNGDPLKVLTSIDEVTVTEIILDKEINKRISIKSKSNDHNKSYLDTKAKKLGHLM